MASDQIPTSGPAAAAWFTRLGLSGKLLAFGGLAGVIVAFLPAASVSVNMPTGGMTFPGMPSGFNVPAMNVNSRTAMVVESWRGAVGLAAYVAALVLAVILYPPNGLVQKNRAWAGICVGGLAVLLAVWLLILVLRAGDVGFGGMGVSVSVGIGTVLNVLAAVTVAFGGFLKAREEKLV